MAEHAVRLDAKAVSHAFGTRSVLRGVDLHVRVGESVAIVGPSGSGKTTLLSVLGGLIPPSGGTVYAQDAHGHRGEPLKHVAWVVQTVNVLPDRTALDNVALGAYAGGVNRVSAVHSATAALRRVGLGDRATTAVRSLSGGEVQRVVIARALAGRHPFIFADEPTGQLDRATTQDVMDSLMAVLPGRALVVVTHDAEVAARCGRTVRLADGRIAG